MPKTTDTPTKAQTLVLMALQNGAKIKCYNHWTGSSWIGVPEGATGSSVESCRRRGWAAQKGSDYEITDTGRDALSRAPEIPPDEIVTLYRIAFAEGRPGLESAEAVSKKKGYRHLSHWPSDRVGWKPRLVTEDEACLTPEAALDAAISEKRDDIAAYRDRIIRAQEHIGEYERVLSLLDAMTLPEPS